MSFKSVLSNIGHILEKIFSPNNISVAASIADIALPQFSGLINVTAGAIIKAEAAAAAAAQQTGTGTQKAALVSAEIEQIYQSFAAANNLPVIPANKQKFIDAIVAALNSFPAPGSTQLNPPTPVVPVVVATPVVP